MSRSLGASGEPLPFTSFFMETGGLREDVQGSRPTRSDELAEVAKAGETDALALAVSLEQATNGTSLVLLLRFGETTMLFPGDAQWGTWDRILHDPESEELLRTVNLYKVGHHGSHNATPASFVSKYLKDADASIVPVAPTGIESWDEIPRIPLLEELAKKSAMVLNSDDLREAARAGVRPRPTRTSPRRRTAYGRSSAFPS